MEIIQIIEDETDHARLLDLALRKARYRTNVALDGRQGLEDARRLLPALILLDVMLPGLDGYQVCRQLRAEDRTRSIPIIMLSALGAEGHRVAGFEIGIDDYITKPFSLKEVVARVGAVLRRSRAKHAGPLALDDGTVLLLESLFRVSVNGRQVQLAELEWLLLRCLAGRSQGMVTWDELYMALWGDCDPQHRHELDRVLNSLNEALAAAQCGRRVQAVPGLGCAWIPSTVIA
jgi:two-component system, OmpR family, phosphate regulon response regulator PhoB